MAPVPGSGRQPYGRAISSADVPCSSERRAIYHHLDVCKKPAVKYRFSAEGATLYRRHLKRAWLCSALLVSCAIYDESLLDSNIVLTRSDGNSWPMVAPLEEDAGDTDASAEPPAIPLRDTRCGDGVISGPEKCDLGIAAGAPGACPSQCQPLAVCAQRVLNGTACQSECVLVEPACGERDGCCPSHCQSGSDSDCSATCGDGHIDSARGETCETAIRPCEQTDKDCDDKDPCTLDRLLGAAENCNSTCTHEPIAVSAASDACCPQGANSTTDVDCLPVCGNRVKEAGEQCDGSAGCGADCTEAVTPEQGSCLAQFAANDCQRCSCLQCTAPFLACRASDNLIANQLCTDVVQCSERTGCHGTACYCAGALCGLIRGPCQTEIERAAGTIDPVAVSRRSTDVRTPLGRAMRADTCRLERCAAACTLTSSVD